MASRKSTATTSGNGNGVSRSNNNNRNTGSNSDFVDESNTQTDPLSRGSTLQGESITIHGGNGDHQIDQKVNSRHPSSCDFVFSTSVGRMNSSVSVSDPSTVGYTNSHGEDINQLNAESECVVASSSSPALFVLQTLPTQSVIAGNSSTENTTLSSLLDKTKSSTGLSINQFDMATNVSDNTAVIHQQNSVVSIEDPSLTQGSIPVMVEQTVANSSLPSTSNLSSEYFVVVENSDGSHVLSRLITGNVLPQMDKDANGSTSVISDSQSSLGVMNKESFSANAPQQQSITVVLGGSSPQLVSPNILLNSNSLLTSDPQSKYVSDQLQYQTIVAAPSSENIDGSASLSLPISGSDMKHFDSAEVYADVEEGYGTIEKSDHLTGSGSDASASVPASCELDVQLNSSSGRKKFTTKGSVVVSELHHGLVSTAFESNVQNHRESVVREDEEAKQKKLVEEQRRLMQSHLQHHIQESKKKHLESSRESTAWTEEMKKLEKLGFTDDTPILGDITADLNSALLKHIPGCHQFLLDLAKENPDSFRNSDQHWSFKGDIKTLIELYNSIKSLIKLRTKTLIRFQTLEDSPETSFRREECPVNEKAISCNLLVPYVSSRGRQLKQSHRFSGSGYVQFSDSFLVSGDLQDHNDEEYGKTVSATVKRCRRKQKRPKKGMRLSGVLSKSQDQTNPTLLDLQNAVEHSGDYSESLQSSTSNNLRDDSEMEKEFLSQQGFLTNVMDMDPLQKRLQEEQIKYREIMDKRLKHMQPKSGAHSHLAEMEITENVSEDKDYSVHSTSSPEHQEVFIPPSNELPVKRRGRPPRKYDHFVTTEKMKPRNPLTESALTKQRRNYEEHMAFKFFCTQCSFKSKRQSHFLNHIQCHKDGQEKKYKCEQCDFVSISPIMLKRHELKHKNVLYKCKICAAYTTDRPSLLQRHVRLKHNTQTKTMQLHCAQCPFTCSTPQGLAKHAQKHRKADSERDDQTGGSHSCKECEKVFRNRMHLQRHIRDVHGPELRPHLCDTCGKAFKRTDALQQHKLVHVARSARQLPFKCSTCLKAFRSQAHLKEHMSMHSSERPYLCQYCGAAFKTQPVQKKHILTLHIKPRTHVCAVCCRQFNTKHALQRHETTHYKSDAATEVAVLEMQKSEKLDEMKSAEELAVLEGQASLSVTPTATITVTGHPSECLVQDLIGTVAAPSGEETQVDSEGQNLPQNFIQGNQASSTMYYFTEDLQPL